MTVLKASPDWLRKAAGGAVVRRERQFTTFSLVALMLFHVALTPLEKGRGFLVLLHGMATLGVALYYGTDPRFPEKTVQAVSYICGAEVWWHMCARNSVLPWEFGKYASALTMIVAMIRRGGIRWMPVLYFALLLPSVALTLMQMDLSSARQAISDSLSGPLAIAVALAFMSQLQLTDRQLGKILLCFVIPMAGVAFLCFSGTFGAAQIDFNNDSNKQASGGYGPNQVSAELGMAIVCAVFALLGMKGRFKLRIVLVGVILWFAVQCGLTFSRTGLYLAAICSCIGALPLLRSTRARWTVVVLVAAFYAVGNFILLPMLNHFTSGALEERFQNESLTHRDVLMKQQLEIWSLHPIFGVGVGLVDNANSSLGYRAHTEYTRMLAEHGSFGLLSLAVLITSVLIGTRRAPSSYGKAFCMAMAAYGFLFMIASGTRLGVVALAFGFSSLRIDAEGPRKESGPPRLVRRSLRLAFIDRTGIRNQVSA